MPGTSGRDGPLPGNDEKVSARPATTHRETAAKGDNLYGAYTGPTPHNLFLCVVFLANLH